MKMISLIPHSNIYSQLIISRQKILDLVFQNFQDKNILPFNISFSVINFTTVNSINKNQTIKETKQLFENSKQLLTLSNLSFDGQFFYINILHPLLENDLKTNIFLSPFYNRFTLAGFSNKQTSEETQKIINLMNNTKITNFESNQIRVFQITELEISESEFQNEKNLLADYKKLTWVKIK